MAGPTLSGYASVCEINWLRPPKQPTKSCFIKCLFLHTFLVGNKILLESDTVTGFSSDCTLSTGLLFAESPVTVFACVHDFCFSVRLYTKGSGIALKWKKYSSGARQFRSNCWTLRAWSMWWRYVFLWWNGWIKACPSGVWCTRKVLSSFTSAVAGEPKNCNDKIKVNINLHVQVIISHVTRLIGA